MNLYESIQLYNVDNIPFYIIVPSSDLSVFSRFTSSTTFVISEEHVLADFRKVVATDTPFASGYLVQQLVKLSFSQLQISENYLCLDSDFQFIADFRVDDFISSDGNPYSFLTEDRELNSSSSYSRSHGSRSQSLLRILHFLDFDPPYILTCHGGQVLNSFVLMSLHSFLLSRGVTWLDAILISPYEFSWYNFYLQKHFKSSVRLREPCIRYFHSVRDFIGYSIAHSLHNLPVGYLGVVFNSDFSRKYQIFSYTHFLRFRSEYLLQIYFALRRRLICLTDHFPVCSKSFLLNSLDLLMFRS